MNPSTNIINQMLSGNTIVVPNYQRAYSWGTEPDANKPPKQVNQFLFACKTIWQAVRLQDIISGISYLKKRGKGFTV